MSREHSFLFIITKDRQSWDDLSKRIVLAIKDIKEKSQKSPMISRLFTILDYVDAGDAEYHINSFQKCLTQLTVIVSTDILKSFNSEDGKFKNLRKILLSIITEYPEVNFIFQGEASDITDALFPIDSSYKQLNDSDEICHQFEDYFFNEKTTITLDKLKELLGYSSRRELFNDEKAYGKYSEIKRIVTRNRFNASLISFTQPDSNMAEIIYATDSLFDASNLRYTIKEWDLLDLHTKDNFSKEQSSRSRHIVIAVDEESDQCRYNSFVSYLNGFRALPVTTAAELLRIREQTFDNKLIIRDFDLQFPDEEKSEVDAIRGYKLQLEAGRKHWVKTESDKYWSKEDYLTNERMYFVSYGYEDSLCFRKEPSSESTVPIIDNNDSVLHVSGWRKPVVGSRVSFIQAIPPMRIRAEDILYCKTDCNYKIVRMRAGRNHSVPLNLYNKCKRMYSRSNNYYNTGQYIESAIIANEAYEMLNGFHQSMALKLYYLKVKSENAAAMQMLGGDDELLAKDAKLRIEIINNDINRLLGENDSSRLNVLNQIFADCRLFCKEKEHFQSEDVFVREMAFLNDGWTASIAKIKQSLGYLFRKENSTDTYAKKDY